MVRKRVTSAPCTAAFRAREKEVAARRPAFKLVTRSRSGTPRPGLVMKGGTRRPGRTGGRDNGVAAPLCTLRALALWACAIGVLISLATIVPLESWGRRAIGLRDGRLVAAGRPLGVERVALLGALDIAAQVPSASGAALAVAMVIANPQEHSLALCASVVTLERDGGGSVEAQLAARLAGAWKQSTRSEPCYAIGADDRVVLARHDTRFFSSSAPLAAVQRASSASRIAARFVVPGGAFALDVEAAAAATRLAAARGAKRARRSAKAEVRVNAKADAQLAVSASASPSASTAEARGAKTTTAFLVLYVEVHNMVSSAQFEYTVDVRVAPRAPVVVVGALLRLPMRAAAWIARAAKVRLSPERAAQLRAAWTQAWSALRIAPTCAATQGRRRRSATAGAASEWLHRLERASYGGYERYALSYARRFVDGAERAWLDGHIVIVLLVALLLLAFVPLARRQRRDLSSAGISARNFSLARVATSSLAHADVWHLASNVGALLHVGPTLHRALACDNIALLAIYAASTLCAAAVSAFAPCRARCPPTYSVGASGAIYGCIAAVYVFSNALPTNVEGLEGEFSFIYRYILRESCSQFDSLPLTSLSTEVLDVEGFLFWAAVDALRTLFARRGVDLLGHFGGAAAGFACAAAYQQVVR